MFNTENETKTLDEESKSDFFLILFNFMYFFCTCRSGYMIHSGEQMSQFDEESTYNYTLLLN